MTDGYAYCQMLYENGEPQDWIYLSTNPAFDQQTGLKDVNGKRVSEAIPGIRQADPKLFEVYSRVALSGQSEKFEMFVDALRLWFSVTVYSPTLGLRYGPDSYGRQQLRIFRNGRKSDGATPRG